MMRSMLLATVALAAASVPAGAAPPASADPVQQFAKCAAQKYDGAELLATQPGSAEEADVLAEFARRGCRSPAQPAAVLRGALAENLFASDFGTIGARPRRQTIEVFTVDAAELAAMDAASKRRLDLLAFATCVAASDPTKTAALLQASRGTPQEAAALAALQPILSPCLSQGERLDLGKSELRAAMAEGAYRLALAHTVDEEIVVTGTRDPARSVTCKVQDVTGTRVKRQVCLTGSQWAERERQTKFTSTDLQRRAQEEDEIQTTIETRSRFPGGN